MSVVTNITVQVAQVEQTKDRQEIVRADEKLQLPEYAQSAQVDENGQQQKRITGKLEETNRNFVRVREFMEAHPDAKVREVAAALKISPSTAGKWMQKARDKR